MRTLLSHSGLTESDRGASAVIGNFDGVHLGHQAVLDLARNIARTNDWPLGVITFEPHPREFFVPDTAPFRLMNAEAKAHRLKRLGVDRLYQLPFNAALSSLGAEAFARDVLKDGLGLNHVVIGADFHFGKGRQGKAADLARLGDQFGFGVTVAELLTVKAAGGPVSSTRIREALSNGQPRHAREMLGHWHRIEGPVLHGAKRGRDLGYPTANMSLDRLHPPRHGVYAALVDVLSGPHKGSYAGVASLGVRPMFGVNEANLETHIFDFAGDLYDRHLSVALVDYLRPELRFDSLDALIRQMDEDSAQARAVLAAV